MARNVSAIVSGMGFGCGFLTALDKACQERGITDEQFHAALKDDSPLIAVYADLIAQSCRSKLLRQIHVVGIPLTEKFVTKDHFVINISFEAKVKIGSIGEKFQTWFSGKTEEASDGSTLRVSRLLQPALDETIIAELGGEEKVETDLVEIYTLLERQARGEGGVLLNNGYANVFYVRDAAGVLRTVFIMCTGSFWVVEAEVLGVAKWVCDRQIFSRYSPSL